MRLVTMPIYRFLHKFALVSLMLLMSCTLPVCASEESDTIPWKHRQVGINMIYLSTTTPNIVFEMGISPRVSISLLVGYNAIKFSSHHNKDGEIINPKLMHFAVMPEVKYWTDSITRRNYWGVHLLYGHYNVGGISLGINSMLAMPFIFSQYSAGLGNFLSTSIRDNRYNGWCIGGGICWGHRFYPSKRIRLDVSIGMGYVYFNYNKHKAYHCGDYLGHETYHYVGPTQISFTISYLLKK